MESGSASDIIRYRLEQADTALADGQYLLDGRRSPQSVANRAYYAMFYATLALLQSAGRVPTKHAGVISLFDTEFVQRGVFPTALSRDLHRAFEQRLKSDYRVTGEPSLEQARDLVARAAAFVAAVKLHFAATKPTDN
ncbi:MAG: HEPN domain-containing protein [bacterium]